jgi:hypothetical protein
VGLLWEWVQLAEQRRLPARPEIIEVTELSEGFSWFPPGIYRTDPHIGAKSMLSGRFLYGEYINVVGQD